MLKYQSLSGLLSPEQSNFIKVCIIIMIMFDVVYCDTGYGKGGVIVLNNMGDKVLLKFGAKIHFN